MRRLSMETMSGFWRFAGPILLIFLAGCTSISPESRRQHAAQLADNAGWQKLRLPSGHFVLTSYVKKSASVSDTLTIYIEGDGFAWVTPTLASTDPSPRNPVGLQLALRHPRGEAAYLARPCQYTAVEDTRNCRHTFWTEGRFAVEVIEASNLAVSTLKQRVGASKLVLVGYSGGGAVAALVAARRSDVAQLITIAGNLDHRAWTAIHRVPPLESSLNPADAWRTLANLPQRHFVGARDNIVTRAVTDAYTARFPAQQHVRVIVIEDFGHVCCWAEKWPEIWGANAMTGH